MATAIVSGSATDFQVEPMADKQLEIIFTPVAPTFRQGNILVTEPIIAIPNPYTFSVTLQTTDDVQSPSYYLISMRWLDSANNYTHVDLPGWRLYVPAGGGIIGDLIRAPWNPTLAWYGPDAPLGDAVANTLWLDTDDGALSIWSN